MAWFKNIPFLSLILLFITYSTFGWYIDAQSPIIGKIILGQVKTWGWQGVWSAFNLAEDDLAIVLIYSLALIAIALIAIGLIAPVALVTIVFGSSFKSNPWSVISILLWSFAFVFMLRWFTFFARFLLLLSAAILAKLDLQDNGYQEWLVFLIVTSICFAGFMIGAITHDWYGQPKLLSI